MDEFSEKALKDMLTYMSNEEFYINSFYIAYWGRPADYEGREYWKGSVGSLDLAGIAENFAISEEGMFAYDYFKIAYTPGAIITDAMRYKFIDQIYNNLFNRAPDASGREYWFQELKSGDATPGRFIADIIYSAQQEKEGNSASDFTTLSAKVYLTEVFLREFGFHMTPKERELAGSPEWTWEKSVAVSEIISVTDKNTDLRIVGHEVMTIAEPRLKDIPPPQDPGDPTTASIDLSWTDFSFEGHEQVRLSINSDQTGKLVLVNPSTTTGLNVTGTVIGIDPSAGFLDSDDILYLFNSGVIVLDDAHNFSENLFAASSLVLVNGDDRGSKAVFGYHVTWQLSDTYFDEANEVWVNDYEYVNFYEEGSVLATLTGVEHLSVGNFYW